MFSFLFKKKVEKKSNNDILLRQILYSVCSSSNVKSFKVKINGEDKTKDYIF